MDALAIGRLFTALPPEAVDAWAGALTAAADEFAILTPEHRAMWLAQLGHESTGLTRLVENMNYSAKRMAQVWPGRYAVDPRAIDKQPNELALALGGYPDRVANDVYANRMGNGSSKLGRGWLYRGRYPAMLTGYDNYSACHRDIGIPSLETPDDLLRNVAGMARVCGWFWHHNNCGQYEDLLSVSQVWNFGAIGSANPIGWADRQMWHERAQVALGIA